jgi:RIO-like serine/threonine protein kinase
LNSSVEKQVLAAFEEIHNLNVLHGDVRPANILVAEDGNKVWIIDFEDGQIIADGAEERESKFSNEMEAVCEMLRDIKKGPSPNGCLSLPQSEIPTPRVPSLEVC